MSDKSKFLGPTKGNRDFNTCRNLDDKLGGSGESHAAFGHNDKFLGSTKGNRDLPPERSSGVGKGKRSVAGGSNAGKSSY